MAKLQDYPGFFGRRKGKALSAARQSLMREMLPLLSLTQPLSPDARTWMEIGFGGGEHLAALMRAHPDIDFIGVEPFINGMSNFLYRVSDIQNPRVRVHMDDAIPLLRDFPDQCLERMYVLNPDPWPKVRHHKRRIINQSNLDLFARAMKPDGLLIMATDVDDLAEWMVTEASKHPSFEWTAESAEDWQTQPEWWAVTTRYAQKGLDAGRRQSYLVFKKVAPQA